MAPKADSAHVAIEFLAAALTDCEDHTLIQQ